MAVAVSTVSLAGCAPGAAEQAAPRYSPAASAFVHRYVAADGRVVRRDQGSDTVSEGQAYGLMITLAAGDRARFGAIWTWTRRHLQRPDQLLSYLWSSGRVADRNPAPDADLDAAVALLRAAAQWGDDGYRRAGTALASAVLRYASVPAAPGRLVTAGPWAVSDPAVLNPSYVVSGTASYLARATGDARWRQVAAATASADRALAAATVLPPDWAQLPSGSAAGDLTPAAAPDGSAPAGYGLDAPRLVIRLATSCAPGDRALAATYAGRLGAPGAVGRRTLDGAPAVDWRNALTDVAVYAAQRAAGRPTAARAALDSATALNRDYPTYYGSAWLALAPGLFAAATKECP